MRPTLVGWLLSKFFFEFCLLCNDWVVYICICPICVAPIIPGWQALEMSFISSSYWFIWVTAVKCCNRITHLILWCCPAPCLTHKDMIQKLLSMASTCWNVIQSSTFWMADEDFVFYILLGSFPVWWDGNVLWWPGSRCTILGSCTSKVLSMLLFFLLQNLQYEGQTDRHWK